MTQLREVSSQNTFGAQNSLTVHFGLGDARKVDRLQITWPSGHVETAAHLPANRHYAAVEGIGIVPLSTHLVDLLIERVQRLVGSGVLNRGRSRALTAKLQAARAKSIQEPIKPAVNVLSAFVRQVAAFVDAGKLTSGQGEALSAPAKTAQEHLLRRPRKATQARGRLSGSPGDSSTPSAFTLSQNYPNPFNPSTEIRFILPETAHVRLSVFDVTGREVARLVEGTLQAGQHSASWDAARLPSGVYVYRLETPQFTQTRRMILTK